MPQKKVLIINGDEGFVRILKLRLEPKGFDVFYEYKMLNSFARVFEIKPDLIILDSFFSIPDGVEAFLHIKSNALLKNTPVLCMVNSDAEKEDLEGLDIHPEGLLVKPYESEELYGLIDSLTARSVEIHPPEEPEGGDEISDSAEAALAHSLIAGGVVDRDKMNELLVKTREGKGSLSREIVRQGLATEDVLLSFMAEAYGLKYAEIREEDIEPEAIKRIPVKHASYYKIMPVKIEDDKLLCAISDPLSITQVKDDIRVQLNQKLEFILASEEKIEEWIKSFYGIGTETIEQILTTADGEAGKGKTLRPESDEDIAKLADTSSVIKLVNQILIDAQDRNASDIHIEPFMGKTKLRYRIDGVLVDAKVSPEINYFLSAIISRIKIMSNLNIVERRLPQDGKARVKINNEMFDLRISTLPAAHGESLVIRILPTRMLFSLAKLGLSDRDRKLFEDLTRRPHGILFVTGPTGSGKTTTLYACLSKIQEEKPGYKIITIEDPIEYELDGITQLQVNSDINFTFARGLKNMLRHDPNIMMIGEVRDLETAEISIQMALTGHLLFSTLHTNDAASGITRLIDIGIEPYLVASSVEAFISQRLVRVICPQCKCEVPRNEETALQITKICEKITTSGDKRRLEDPDAHLYPRSKPPLSASSLSGERRRLVDPYAHLYKQPSATLSSSSMHWLRAGESCFKGKGCKACNFTGYKGRTAIYEILPMTEKIKALIQEKATAQAINKQAVLEGMRTLYQCGFDKVISGITTFEEVLRVTKEDVAGPDRMKER
ncbi:MAG: ATPase, T2SS/T4P/T4SS family [Candidatus Omnitrophota bacterium]